MNAACEAVQQNDEMFCARCGLRWEVGGDYEPACLPREGEGDGNIVKAIRTTNYLKAVRRDGTSYLCEGPGWLLETGTQLAIFEGSLIAVNPSYRPMILRPGEIMFVDVTGIT
jgi:hypothetical protein